MVLARQSSNALVCARFVGALDLPFSFQSSFTQSDQQIFFALRADQARYDPPVTTDYDCRRYRFNTVILSNRSVFIYKGCKRVAVRFEESPRGFRILFIDAEHD